MDLISTYLNLPITNPTWIFFLVLCIILFAPMILSKLHIPHLIGMILAGVIIGENGLNILQRDRSFELFGQVGIYFIMFLAGLEMDMQNLKLNRTRGIIFGSLTTLIPFGFGFATGYYLLGYSIPASLLLSCIMASHTLVAYTIVGRYGVTRNPAVTISVVATMIALLASLIFLAAMGGVLNGSTDVWFWLLFIGKCAGFALVEFLVVPRLTRFFFRKFIEPVMQFTYTLAIVFFSAALAEVCGLEGILGAFLSGLVLNRFIPHTSPLMNRLEFVGNALFVPYFLIGVGMLINISPMFHEIEAVLVVITMVIAGTLSKYIAALCARKVFHFTSGEGLMMFGLTEAHAAGALAMVLVGTRLEIAPGVPLMNSAVLDGVVMMILISCIISSIATDQAAKKIKLYEKEEKSVRHDSTSLDDEKILIPINYKGTIQQLMLSAIMMRNPKLKRGLICLNIINDADLNDKTRANSQECLDMAAKIAAASDVPVQTQSRLAVNFVTATIHSFNENHASEMIIGLHRKANEGDDYFGQFAQGLIENMSRQLIIVNLKQPAHTLHNIYVAVPDKAQYEKGFYRWINRLARMSADLGASIEFFSPENTGSLIMRYMKERHKSVRAEYSVLDSWDDFPALRHEVKRDDLLIVVTARKGSISYQNSFNKLGYQLEHDFTDSNIMVVFPDQQEENNETYTFSDPHYTPTSSTANTRITQWFSKWIGEMG